MKTNKFDFLRIFFLISSIAIILLGIFLPEARTSKAIVMGLMIFALVVLDKNMTKVTKLSEDNPKVRTMRSINRLILGVIVLLGTYYIFSPIITVPKNISDKIIIIGLAIFIMVFGNISPKIPFNRYMGLRLPWTIRDEDTWRLAHRILGYISFPLGILMIIASFFFKSQYIAGVGIITWILIPGLYSLWFYYKKFQV